MEGIKLSLKYPGNRGYLARKAFEDLRKTTMQTFFDFCPEGIIKSYNKSLHWLEFVNGSEIQFGDLENRNKLKSLNLGWYGIDEASETTKDVDLIMQSRLRLKSDKPVDNWKKVKQMGKEFWIPNYYGLYASNPEPCWLKEDFVEEPGTDHVFIRSLPSDNPYLPPDYIESLEANADEDWIKRYLQGDWGTFEGQIYKAFNRDRNVIEPFKIPKEWRRYRSIDLGVDDPTACLWFAVDSEQNVYLYKEYYESNRPTEDHAEDICMMSGKDKYSGTIFDHHGLGKQLIIDYNRLGVKGTDHKEHRIVAGIARVQQLLKLQGVEHKPKLFVFDNCIHTIKEFESYRWDTRKRDLDLNSKETPLDRDNHCVTGDTLVWTLGGKKKIKDMVGTTGWVNTPYGIYPYKNCRKIGNKVTTEYNFEGHKIKATSDHKIQTPAGDWKELFDIQSDDVIQLANESNIKNNSRVQWGKVLSLWRKILPPQFKKQDSSATSSSGLGVPQWKHPYGLPHSPQGWEYGEQPNREFRDGEGWESFKKTYDTRAKGKSEKECSEVCNAKSQSLAQDKRGTQVSSEDIKDSLEEEGKGKGSLSVLWGRFQDILSRKNKVLSFQLPSENISRSKDDSRRNKNISLSSQSEIGYEDVYDMEVGGVHCFVVNDGFVIRNCMDCLKNWTVTFYYSKTPTKSEQDKRWEKEQERKLNKRKVSSITNY